MRPIWSLLGPFVNRGVQMLTRVPQVPNLGVPDESQVLSRARRPPAEGVRGPRPARLIFPACGRGSYSDLHARVGTVTRGPLLSASGGCERLRSCVPHPRTNGHRLLAPTGDGC